MALNRLIAIEQKFTNGVAVTWSQALPNPGFVPHGYRVLTISYAPTSSTQQPCVLQHNRLGVLGVLAPASTPATHVGGQIDNADEVNYHSGALSTFTVTRDGAPVTDLNGRIIILIECYRRAPPAAR